MPRSRHFLTPLVLAFLTAAPSFPCSLVQPLPPSDVFTAAGWLGPSSTTYQDPVTTVGPRPVFFHAYTQLQRLTANGFENVDVVLVADETSALGRTVYRPASPLADGDYRSGINPIVRVASALASTVPVMPRGAELTVTVIEPIQDRSVSCGTELVKCGAHEPFLDVGVLVPGIGYANFIANYVVYLSDDAGSNETQVLGATEVLDGVARVTTRIALAPTAEELCVAIAGVGWDGSVGEAANVGCSPLRRR